MNHLNWKSELLDIVRKLANPPGPSGREDLIGSIVVELMKPHVDRLWIDTLGNVIGFKKGKKSDAKIMIAAHMDEIGMFISHIEDDGYLRVVPIGGVFERSLVYQRVLISTRDGKVYRGVIGLRPPHVAKPEEAQKVPEIRELFIDIGASSRDEVEKLGIKVGDIAVFDREVVELMGDKISGKAFDDRIGVATMIKALQLMETPGVDTYFVATVQEEGGVKGARTSAYAISPDVALAIDVTIANDTPGVPKSEWCTRLGKGPAIKIADGRGASGLIVHPKLVDFLISIAEKRKIPYQLEILTGGTTDASIIALNKEGVPAGAISIPTRYVHSPVEVVDLNDVYNAAQLVKGFVEEIDTEWVKSIKGALIK
ncbi:MAG: M42 family metallopeptidase [Desulfurococcaceae archaeon]